jgi:hypothetical protein
MKDNEYKIMLIEPPYYRLFKDTYSLALYPLSLGYLAGTIRKETDWSVMAYNAEFNPPGEAIKIRHLTGDGHHHYINNLRDPSGTAFICLFHISMTLNINVMMLVTLLMVISSNISNNMNKRFV